MVKSGCGPRWEGMFKWNGTSLNGIMGVGLGYGIFKEPASMEWLRVGVGLRPRWEGVDRITRWNVQRTKWNGTSLGLWNV